MNTTDTLSVTIIIHASAEHVFTKLTDWPAQSEWMIGTKVHATEQEGKGINGKLSAFTGIGRVGFIDTMTITAWEPPYICSVIHTGRVVRGDGDFIIKSINVGSSTFTWSERIIVPFGVFGRVAWVGLKPLARWGLRYSVKRFSKWATIISK